MSFEEQFPSLTGYHTPLERGDVIGAGGTFYLKEFIEDFCLDKKKVKEAINILFDDDEWWEMTGAGLKIRIFKELGL